MQFVSTCGLAAEAFAQFYTPEDVARSLVSWAVRDPTDRLLDPSCGDGAVIRHHELSRGAEIDPYAAFIARERAPSASVENVDFFSWAIRTEERFDCAAGNPPFIRHQKFKGSSREAAALLCAKRSIRLSALSSTWAAFIVATANLLKPGGRMAFVVPAEIGHAPYARALLQFLLDNFRLVHVTAVQEKLFPRLSQDCWLLYCDGFGSKTDKIAFSQLRQFKFCAQPPEIQEHVAWSALENEWEGRLRHLLLPVAARELYLQVAGDQASRRFGAFARIGIGYISGDNNFFHLSAGEARRRGLPAHYLVPTVRKGASLKRDVIDEAEVAGWSLGAEPSFLLNLPAEEELPPSVVAYLDSPAGLRARTRYKCRTRRQWYSVPGVVRPDYFLQYMSGRNVRLARNLAGTACTNSILAVTITDHREANTALACWTSPFVQLSCELEGHPLGGGMLKLEPGEALKVVFPGLKMSKGDCRDILAGVETMRAWRHIRQGAEGMP